MEIAVVPTAVICWIKVKLGGLICADFRSGEQYERSDRF
jgi:hypothetical protein